MYGLRQYRETEAEFGWKLAKLGIQGMETWNVVRSDLPG